tara:strand:+ start:81 stop:845 length:765 start_codon:yes stop_codon:yes gene_type:complete
MITCNLIGGLGNKMFQITAAYSLGLDNNEPSGFEITPQSNDHSTIDSYRNNIFRHITFGGCDSTNSFMEPRYHYSDIPYTPNLRLLGYYQSEKYFINNRDSVLSLFSIDVDSKKYIEEKYGDNLTKNTTSLHVRRGDYLKLSNHHPTCDLSYYNKAMESFGDDTTYLVFSDDTQWCRESFVGDNFIFVDGNPDYIDMWLMSLCDNNIIANSSFSWWGAWLNTNPNKKVIAPNKWFGPAIKHNTKDLIPNTWEKI